MAKVVKNFKCVFKYYLKCIQLPLHYTCFFLGLFVWFFFASCYWVNSGRDSCIFIPLIYICSEGSRVINQKLR